MNFFVKIDTSISKLEILPPSFSKIAKELFDSSSYASSNSCFNKREKNDCFECKKTTVHTSVNG